MAKNICIYHGNCADGFTAAWAVRKALGDVDTEYVAGFYGKEPPDVSGKHVIMVDFSYKRPVIEEMRKTANSILILDHHKTAQEDLKDYPPPIVKAGWDAHLDDVTGFASDGTDPSLPRCIFDMERSGARITWDFFHPMAHVPHLVRVVEDRDLWRFALANTRSLMTAIFSYEYTWQNWDELDSLMYDSEGREFLITAGEAIDRKHFKDIRELLKACTRGMEIGGHVVSAASLPYTMSSDAANMLAEGKPFGACYMDTPSGRVFSLRSKDDGLDVSEIAKAYGGGGHARAAGFEVPRDHPLAQS